MLVALTYYFVPRITGTPLYSHVLSLVSFWGIAFFYSGVGHHHILQAPIPDWVRTVAVINSVLILVAVIAFFANIWATMRSNWDKFITNLPLRYVITGFIFYILVNFQGAGQALPYVNDLIHFTNWVVAHSHMALLGGFTILGEGVIAYIIPQILKRPLWSDTMLNWQYWLITIGFIGFFLVLTFASFLQGQGWQIGMPVVNTLPFLRLHYIMRAFFGSMIFTSAILQAVNIIATYASDTSAGKRVEMKPYISAGEKHEREKWSV
jgi:cytochrome c oxidase cbb3-type subunit I/II